MKHAGRAADEHEAGGLRDRPAQGFFSRLSQPELCERGRLRQLAQEVQRRFLAVRRGKYDDTQVGAVAFVEREASLLERVRAVGLEPAEELQPGRDCGLSRDREGRELAQDAVDPNADDDRVRLWREVDIGRAERERALDRLLDLGGVGVDDLAQIRCRKLDHHRFLEVGVPVVGGRLDRGLGGLQKPSGLGLLRFVLGLVALESLRLVGRRSMASSIASSAATAKTRGSLRVTRSSSE